MRMVAAPELVTTEASLTMTTPGWWCSVSITRIAKKQAMLRKSLPRRSLSYVGLPRANIATRWSFLLPTRTGSRISTRPCATTSPGMGCWADC
jgi:hypothetical protein